MALVFIHPGSYTIVKSTNEEFRLENLDLQKPVPCGSHKCMFPLKQQRVGYLVMQAGAEVIERMRAAWFLGEFLRAGFHAKHLMLAPPKEVEISQTFASQLNSNIFHLSRNQTIGWSRYKAGTATVQKVALAPETSMLYKGDWRRYNHFVLSVENKTEFARRTELHLAICLDIVKKVRCLARDFQVFIDTEGNFYHLDLDRCFKAFEKNEGLDKYPYSTRLMKLEGQVSPKEVSSNPPCNTSSGDPTMDL